jgi:iron complex outermembrane receptor protein
MYRHYNKRFLRHKTIAVAVMLALSQIAYAEEVSEESSIQLEEVIVTGTKRKQALQEAVQSVTVFEEEDTIGLQFGLDIFKYIPNTTFQSSQFLPVVRGLNGNGIATGGGGAVSGARPRMTTYIDGVARSYNATPDGQGSFWDFEQIEIYKGSQSTQLGRNSIAGAIVQTTKDPIFKDEFSVQAGLHDQDLTYSLALMANKKISDQVAIRMTAEGFKGDNFVDYSPITTSPSLTGLSTSDPDDLSDEKYTRFRFKALVAPTEIPDLLVKITLESERSANPFTRDIVQLSGRGRESQTRSYGYYRGLNRVASINTLYQINDEWNFDGILSYQHANTNFGGPQVGNPNPAQYLDFSFSTHETTFEPKLNFKSKDTRTNAVIGAYYFTRSRTDTGAPGSAFVLTAEDEASTKSVFADAAFQLNKEWDILLGGRLEKDQQKRDFSAFSGLLALSLDETNNVFLPKLGATYHFSDEASLSLMTYKGYNTSGGGLSFVTFTPYTFAKETSLTTELVSRTQWFNKTLTANANIFYTRLKDTQVSGIGPAGPLDAIYLNLEKAKTYGAEMELSYQPTQKDRAFFSLGLLQTEVVDFGSVANNGNNGNELGLAPNITARIGGSSEIYPNLILGGDVSYTGKRYTDFNNLKADELDSFAITNINARYQYKNATITGYVNNLFDKYALLQSFASTNTAYVNAPRTVGFNVRFDF